MGYRIYREDYELDRLIDECLDLRVKVSLSTDDDSAELRAMRKEIFRLEERIATRQRTMRNPAQERMTA